MKIASSWLSPTGESLARPGIDPAEVLPLLLVLSWALITRILFLDQVPTNVMPDEADNMVDVLHILAGTGPGLIGFDWTQLPALNVHLMAAFVRLFGASVVGMRMAVVFTSTLALVPFYMLCRRVVSPQSSILATMLLSTSLWYLNFSRTAWSNVHVVLFGLSGVLFLLEAVDRRRWQLFALAGAGLALTLYGYYAGRAVVAAVLLFLPTSLAMQPRRLRGSTLRGYLLMLGVAITVFLPQGLLIASNWDYANTRVSSVSIFNQQPPYLGESDPARLLMQQAARVVRGFVLLDGGMFHTPRYTPEGVPPLDYGSGLLYVGGLILGLSILRETAIWYLLAGATLVLTQVLSIGTPDTGRAIFLAPVCYLFVGVSLDALSRWRVVRRAHSLLPVLVFGLVVYNLWWYFDWARQPTTAAARQPAVEYSEYHRWLEMQMARASRGEPGFTVTEWHQMRTLPLERP